MFGEDDMRLKMNVIFGQIPGLEILVAFLHAQNVSWHSNDLKALLSAIERSSTKYYSKWLVRYTVKLPNFPFEKKAHFGQIFSATV